MASEKRVLKVNSLLKRELANIFLKELVFSEGVLVSISDVKTASNLTAANVKISVMPEGKLQEVLNYLNKNIFDIQKKLNKKLNMRPVPKIYFRPDLTEAKAQKIEEIIEKIKKEEGF